MGLMDYTEQFAKEYKNASGFVRRERLAEWFGKKESQLRDGYTEPMEFTSKTAVVIVGVSGIGKTRYVQKLLEICPSFVMISSDEASYAKVEEEKRKKQKMPDGWATRFIEQKIEKSKDENLVIDSLLVNPVHRAAMLRYLSDLGYVTYIVYFSQEYTEKNVDYFFGQRAAELIIFEEYLTSNNTSKMSMQQLMKIRKNIVEEKAKVLGIEPQVLKAMVLMQPAVRNRKDILKRAYEDEISTNRVWWQEKRGIMYLGADYCYIL